MGRWKHTATLLADGRVLVTGGFNGGQLSSAEIYDPVAETWSATAGPMTVARYHHLASLLPSGKVLVTGGFSSATAKLFDPATGTFAGTGSPLTSIGFGSTVTLLPNGPRARGRRLLRPTSSNVYDPARGTWSAGPSLTPGRDTHAAALLLDGRVLVAGGCAVLQHERAFRHGPRRERGLAPDRSHRDRPRDPQRCLGSRRERLPGARRGLDRHRLHAVGHELSLVQLRRLDNELVNWLPVDPAIGWSGVSFRSTAITGIPTGPALVTVFTSGIPSVSRSVCSSCPPPTIAVPPSDATVCAAGSATSTVTATAGATARPTAGARTACRSATSRRTPDRRLRRSRIAPVTSTQAGSYDVQVSLACSSSAVTSAPERSR